MDTLCLTYGDKFEATKIYLKVYNPFVVSELLFNYATLTAFGEIQNYKANNPKLQWFAKSSKIRRSNTLQIC